MDVETFWRVVDQAHARAGDDTDRRVDELREQLSSCDPGELQQFQDIYDEQIRRSYRWDLWGAAYVMNGGCSDDGFRYFRDWLISEGRVTFEKALASPESLAELPRVEFAELESFGHVARELFEEQGEGELDRDFSTDMSMPAGEQWDEDDLTSLFPRLGAVYLS
jgi:Protein of unknown function (DUF4240)